MALPLQRSRGPKTAESPFTSAVCARNRSASTEPRSEDRGEGRLTLRAQPAAMLQRSRGPKTAERCRATGIPSAGDLGFNGAAVRRPRRVFGLPFRWASYDPLQRSRGPKTAERPALVEAARPALRRFNGAAVRRPRRAARRGRREWARYPASTEPRSEDRGESLRAVPSATCLTTLQRSRGPKTAESGSRQSRQGKRQAASTEPRSEDRGEPETGSLPPLACVASTEPRSEDRGEVMSTEQPEHPPTSFNGAAVRRPRRGTTMTPDRSGPTWLQRSRGPKTAESP